MTYEQWKQTHDGGGVSAVIYGIPVGANYEEYQANAQKFFDAHNESLSIDYSRAIALEQFTTNDLKGYQACLEALRVQKPGLFLSFDHLDQQSGVLNI